ncbi:MAG: TRAP transporter small permease subunit [Pseudomonadota bacterium]
MTVLLILSRAIDALSTFVGQAMRWAILAAVLISASNAILRRTLALSSNGWLEVQWYLFGAVFLFGAAYTLRRAEHVKIDFLLARLSPRNAVRVALFGHIAFLMPVCLVMVVLSVPWAWASILSGETSANAGGLPLWPAKAAIPIGFALLAAQTLSEIIRSIAQLRGHLPMDLTAGIQPQPTADSTDQGYHD